MPTGKVKWFNNAKGYGFVLAECADEDLFVHYSSIQMNGYRTLRAGQEVTFDIQQGPKGLHAVNVRALDEQAYDADVEANDADVEAYGSDIDANDADDTEDAASEHPESDDGDNGDR